MARKKQEENIDANGWMNTYADMVTLLLCFFVMLLATSSQDEEKWAQLVKAFSKFADTPQQIVINPAEEGDELAASEGEKEEDGNVGNDKLGDELPQTFDDLYSYLKKYVDDNGLEDSISLQKNDNHVFVRFKDNIFFNPNSSVLKNSAYVVLDYIGEGLKSLEEKIMIIKVNGHTASVKDGTCKISDRTLSTDRANAVLNYFEGKVKIAPEKLIATGFGKNFPVATNDNEEGRRQNRRVELVIVDKNISSSSPEEMMQILSNKFEVEHYSELADIEDSLKAMSKEEQEELLKKYNQSQLEDGSSQEQGELSDIESELEKLQEN